MTMLDLAKLDLSDVCMALEDNSPEHSWWIDPATGEAERFVDEVERWIEDRAMA
jgi:hypothetical protein